MPFTTYLKNEVLEQVFSQSTITAMPFLYVALATATPTGATAQFKQNEVATNNSTNGYDRVQLSNTDNTNWTTASNGSVSNASQIVFNPASISWSQVTHFGIFDAALGASDNLLAYGQLTVAKNINTSDTASFAAGSMVFTLT